MTENRDYNNWEMVLKGRFEKGFKRKKALCVECGIVHRNIRMICDYCGNKLEEM